MRKINIETMAQHYIIAAIWADCPEGTHPKATRASKKSALAYLGETHNAEWCTTYGEPGYVDPTAGIILANWNNIPKGLVNWLEKCGYSLEWPDEWMIDYVYSKAYRTQADSYHWEPSILLPVDACEYITPDDSVDTWIEACAISTDVQPVQCLPSWFKAASPV